MSRIQRLERWLIDFGNKLRIEQGRKGIVATGASARSLREEVKRDGQNFVGRIYGFNYWEYQVRGRGPTPGGAKRGRPTLRERIRLWLDYKPFSRGLRPKIKDSMSYAIAKNIHRRGTLRGNDPRYPGIPLQGMIQKEVPKLSSSITRLTVEEVRLAILPIFRQAA